LEATGIRLNLGWIQKKSRQEAARGQNHQASTNKFHRQWLPASCRRQDPESNKIDDSMAVGTSADLFKSLALYCMQQAFKISVVTVSLLVELLIAKNVVGIPIRRFLLTKLVIFPNKFQSSLILQLKLRLEIWINTFFCNGNTIIFNPAFVKDESLGAFRRNFSSVTTNSCTSMSQFPLTPHLRCV